MIASAAIAAALITHGGCGSGGTYLVGPGTGAAPGGGGGPGSGGAAGGGGGRGGANGSGGMGGGPSGSGGNARRILSLDFVGAQVVGFGGAGGKTVTPLPTMASTEVAGVKP